MTLALVVAALGGIAVGVAATLLAVRLRSRHRAVAAAAHPVAPPAPRWSDVVDRLSLGVVVSGSSGLVHYRNRAARALEGTHMGVLVDDAVERMLRAARDGEESRQTLELYGPPRVAVVVRASPLEGGGAVATIEDVSERRRVDAVRTDFVANISHELKTPVGALALLAETMADEDDLGVVHRIAARMIDESHRVSRTIDDLLELSRIELGEEPIRDIVDVIDVVDGAIERSRPIAEARRTAIE